MKDIETYTQDEVLELTGWSRATLYRKRQLGDFPEPFRKEGRNLLWRKSEVDMQLKEEALVSDVVWQLIQRKYSTSYETALERYVEQARQTAWMELGPEIEELAHRIATECYTNIYDDHLEGWIANSDCCDMEELAFLAEGSAMDEARQWGYERACEELSGYAESSARQLAHDWAVQDILESIRAKSRESSEQQIN